MVGRSANAAIGARLSGYRGALGIGGGQAGRAVSGRARGTGRAGRALIGVATVTAGSILPKVEGAADRRPGHGVGHGARRTRAALGAVIADAAITAVLDGGDIQRISPAAFPGRGRGRGAASGTGIAGSVPIAARPAVRGGRRVDPAGRHDGGAAIGCSLGGCAAAEATAAARAATADVCVAAGSAVGGGVDAYAVAIGGAGGGARGIPANAAVGVVRRAGSTAIGVAGGGKAPGAGERDGRGRGAAGGADRAGVIPSSAAIGGREAVICGALARIVVGQSRSPGTPGACRAAGAAATIATVAFLGER
jgi:hypothetical protein